MKIELARPGNVSEIKQMLLDCGLPHENISIAHLDHYLIMRDDDRLFGVVGAKEKDYAEYHCGYF